MQDMVSVITPVYNRENYIKECISSILKQTHQNFEIILIDDGSTDKSVEICEDLAKSDSRIKLFFGEHAGVSAARNRGLKEASGDYVFFLDSDDAIHPEIFEIMVTALKKSDALIAAGDVLLINDMTWDKHIATFMSKDEVSQTVYKSSLQAINENCRQSTPLGCIGGVMIKRSLIGDTVFKSDLFIGEDYYFIYENLVKNAPCIFLKEKLYFARQHKSNTSWQYDFKGFWTRFHRRELVWRTEESFGRTANAKAQRAEAFSCFLKCIKRNKPYSPEAKQMRKTIKSYKKELFPYLSHKNKLYYLLSIYTPLIYSIILKLKKGKRRKKRR